MGLRAMPISERAVELTWMASFDDEAVAGYHVYRDGERMASVQTVFTTDEDAPMDGPVCYTVSAYDTDDRESAPSEMACGSGSTARSAGSRTGSPGPT